MKTLKYIWRNITRNKLRSLLTMLSIGFSLALMTVLNGYLAMQDAWGGEAKKHHRIVVMSTQGFTGMVPIANVERLRSMPDIAAAVPFSWFGGEYKDERNSFAQFGTDPAQAFQVWPEYRIDEDQLRAFQTERQGCVADRRLAQRMKWQIGDRIPLRGTFNPVTLDLKLVGLYDAPQNTETVWFNWYYLDESLKAISARNNGNCGTIFAKTTGPESMAPVSKAIDERFESTDNPTRTQTEAAFAQMFTDMLGNIQAIIFNIGLAVVFSLTLVAATAMAMSIRERTTEIAVLKAIGFSRLRVLLMVLGESCGIAVLGGLLGIGMGCFFLQTLHNASPNVFPLSVIQLAGDWIVRLLLVAVGVGLVGGIVPAVRSSQLSVIDGLRRVV